MRFASLIVAVFAARFFATALFFPTTDGDLGWQRWLGDIVLTTGRIPRSIGAETFSAPGSPWIPQEWLFSIGASLSQGASLYALPALCALSATAALMVSAWRASRDGTTPIAVAVVVSFAGVALLESFGVRAQVIAWPFVALFLLCIELDGRRIYWALGVVAVWSNVHASVTMAPALAGILCLGSALENGLVLRTKRLFYIMLASVPATCTNPLGWAVPYYAVTVFLSPFKSMIDEWQHTEINDISFAFGSLPLLLILVLFGIYGQRRWSERLLVATMSLLMFMAKRDIPIFAIACFPAAARSLSSQIAFLSRPDRSRGEDRLKKATLERWAATLTPILGVIAALGVGAAVMSKSRTAEYTKDDLKPALAAIVGMPNSHNVFCADFAWCSFLISSGRHDRVFMDGRADPYPMPIWNDDARITSVKPGWNTTLHRHRADVVLVDVSSPLEQVLELSGDWRSVYRNATYRVWITRPHFFRAFRAK